eukprot:5605156-Amphidinium_carterae.1
MLPALPKFNLKCSDAGEAQLELSAVTIMECHGTGTALGDPIEVAGMLTMRQTPPNLHFKELMIRNRRNHESTCIGWVAKEMNPHIDVEEFAVTVPTDMMQLEDATITSGLSSFGFGGA